MIKKIVVVSIIIASAIMITMTLSSNMNIETSRVEGIGDLDKSITTIHNDSTIVRIVANAGSNSFSPNHVEVKVGEMVTWINDDSGSHTVTAKDDTFGSSILRNGQSFSYTFDKAGEYPYFCEPHPNMVGMVMVTER